MCEFQCGENQLARRLGRKLGRFHVTYTMLILSHYMYLFLRSCILTLFPSTARNTKYLIETANVTTLQRLLVWLGNYVKFTDHSDVLDTNSAPVYISRVKTPRKASHFFQSLLLLQLSTLILSRPANAQDCHNNLATGNLIHRVFSDKLRLEDCYVLCYFISAEVTYFPIPVLC